MRYYVILAPDPDKPWRTITSVQDEPCLENAIIAARLEFQLRANQRLTPDRIIAAGILPGAS